MDLTHDTYFLLKGALQEAFRDYLTGDPLVGDNLDRLLAHGLLVERDSVSAAPAQLTLPVPLRSVSELAPERRQAHVATILEVMRLVYTTRRTLRTRNIGDVLEAHRAFCRIAPFTGESGSETCDLPALADATDQYRAARRFVPIEPSCLLDSLALHRFLARRGLRSRLVFGVNAEPFSAHAWLQTGDLALNETVSYARMHTPILVL